MADEIPQWAKERAVELSNARYPDSVDMGSFELESLRAFAAYIAAHEEQPEDPLLIEARRIVSCNKSGRYSPATEELIEAGEFDREEPVQVALAALRRGIELGKAGEA